MIPESLAGRRLAITGSTGFLGTALVERLLHSVPDCELVLLVRPGRRSPAERVRREVLKNDAFDRLRARHGADGFAELCDRRVHAVAGDVGVDGLGLDDEGRAALATCDVVIHSAATVAFDSPFDLAVEVNLLGPTRIAQTVRELGASPHLIAVSTCYVAGTRRGEAPERPLHESPFFVDIDWRTEVETTRRRRMDAEIESRDADRLATFEREARSQLGAAGTALLAARTEQHRERWVKSHMVDAGRARAASVGFPDAYAFTKALGERALLETRGDLPVTIVRPSIIESALEEPFPGWIRGFRMAEPILLNYGRGVLTEFPGVPEGVVDVIPIDHVTAAIVAVAAQGPDPEPSVVQVASGAVNPFLTWRLIELARRWYSENPLYDDRDQPISPPPFTYPGRGRVQAQLTRAKRGLETAERLLHRLPIRGRQAEFSATLEERREQVERALEYVELYGAYTECEATYSVDRLLERWDRLDETDQAAFSFDPRVIDWEKYLLEVHFPSVMRVGRVKTAPTGRSSSSRHDRLRRAVLSPDRHLAAFDLENTLIASNVVASYGWLATRRLDPADRTRLITRTLLQAPGLLLLDRRDRSDFLRSFYRRYDHAPVDQLDEDSLEMFSDLILAKSFPAAIRRVRRHRELGHRTVLITGALDFVTEPLRPLFDDILCASLQVEKGNYTGHLRSVPPTGETRAELLHSYAEEHGLDLAQSIAYADSTSDLPMLEAVSYPVAVNPETKLATIARRRGWLVEDFHKSPGSPRKLLPIGARRTA